ncbi:MAG: hypothetical protein JRJ70_05210 [Deltaproteobacteria bacterium]|nr:hypothetical protein [Deltaproteobacteria bacterium]
MLRQRFLDFPQPHLGEMVAYGASGHGDIAPLFELGRYLATGGLSGSDDIDDKLLDKLSFHRRGDTVLLLLALTTVYQRDCAFLIESACKNRCISGGYFENLSHLSVFQKAVVQHSQ